MHLNAVGAIVPNRSELTADAVGRCTVLVADSIDQAAVDSAEMRAAAAENLLDWSSVLGLADVVADPGRGRRDPQDVTLFKALGVGLSDVALGAELLLRGRARGIGSALPATRDPHSVSQVNGS